MDNTDHFIDRVQHLPPAPTIITELLALFSDPNRNVDRIVELISLDPSLTAEVLKRCNSAFFRGAEPASGIFEAVTRLGFFEVYSVVTTLVSARTLALARNSTLLDPALLWRHTVTTAVASATIARRAVGSEAVAFTSGLLHDIGKLILVSVEGAAYARVLQQAGTSGAALARAEEVAFGISHAALGARLLTRWGLPRSICLVALHHHHTPAAAAPFERLTAAVQLANEFAHHLTVSPAADTRPGPPGNPEALALLQLNADDVALLLEQTVRDLEPIRELLEMKP
jgi:putative nucleotidyltransferase with HDIG domain